MKITKEHIAIVERLHDMLFDEFEVPLSDPVLREGRALIRKMYKDEKVSRECLQSKEQKYEQVPLSVNVSFECRLNELTIDMVNSRIAIEMVDMLISEKLIEAEVSLHPVGRISPEDEMLFRTQIETQLIVLKPKKGAIQ